MQLRGVSKSIIVTFSVGILFGFGLTYMLAFSSVFRITPELQATSLIKVGGSYLPVGPHSHGEVVDVNSPQRSVLWKDDHSFSHLGNYISLCIDVFSDVKEEIRNQPKSHFFIYENPVTTVQDYQ